MWVALLAAVQLPMQPDHCPRGRAGDGLATQVTQIVLYIEQLVPGEALAAAPPGMVHRQFWLGDHRRVDQHKLLYMYAVAVASLATRMARHAIGNISFVKVHTMVAAPSPHHQCSRVLH